ncbi:hypothetical protein J7I93_03290 [Bacillus sp. ISL-47]|uniref:hypothetical protein n=1 Tax=Bacillus sp. ISL-47 TaxID=2819130 RepID=UPI001BE5B7F8|nr:hypothetical protein [Bacillus sp. ISL-47]MBT2687203.1 hypothetical protein [Bacillus sp. ISL-47]MBT2709803.1 hypothetical protein [Pseudomonas sp. ISL-84]
MEKQINDLAIFNNYQNCQVILNYYEDGLLSNREGFHFSFLKISGDCLSFYKNNEKCFTISLKEFPLRNICSDFQHYFIFHNNKDRVEIYFTN